LALWWPVNPEANFAVFLGFFQRFSSPIGANKKLWIIIEGHAVNLPEIQVIGLKSPQRFFQHGKRETGVPAVGASLSHQKHFVPTALQPRTHPQFRFSSAILPAIVEKCNSTVDGLMNHLYGCLFIRRFTEMMAAKPERRNLRIGASEFSNKYCGAGGRRHKLALSL
jgi:hypothetical protein